MSQTFNMLLTLTTNRCTRIVNLHSSFLNLNKKETLEDKVKSLCKDLATGQKIKTVTIDNNGEVIYSFSSGFLKDSERRSNVAEVPALIGARSNRPQYARKNHLQKAEKINFLRG